MPKIPFIHDRRLDRLNRTVTPLWYTVHDSDNDDDSVNSELLLLVLLLPNNGIHGTGLIDSSS